MSTTIYNGFKVPAKTMEELISFCRLFQERAEEEKVRLVYEYLYWSYLINLDKALLPSFFPQAKKPSFDEVRRELEDRIFNDRFSTDVLINFKSEAIFFASKAGIICTFYGSLYSKLWESFPGVEDYHYQDQTDPPEDIPYADFQERGKNWEEVLGDAAPSTRGFSYEFTNKEVYFIWTNGREALLKHQPSKSVRIKHLMDIIIDDRRMESIRSTGIQINKEQFAQNHRQEIESIMEELKKTLPETLDDAVKNHFKPEPNS